MSQVFLLNYSGHDFTDALRYGDKVITLTEGNLDLRHTDRIRYTLEKKLTENEYNYETDFIVLMSSAVIAAQLMRVLKDKPYVRTLVFDAKSRKYIERKM